MQRTPTMSCQEDTNHEEAEIPVLVLSTDEDTNDEPKEVTIRKTPLRTPAARRREE